jgi:hypothetical protein
MARNVKISKRSETPMKRTILMLFVISPFLFTFSLASDSPKPFTDTKQTYTVSCSGHGKSWTDCYQEADSLCPDGYNTIKKSTGVISTPVYGKSILAPSKKLIIECK